MKLKKIVTKVILVFLFLLLISQQKTMARYVMEKPIFNMTLNLKMSEPEGIYAKLYDTDGDGIGDYLILGSHKNISHEGTLINDYNYIDNTSREWNTSWRNDLPTIETVEILEEIVPTSTSSWFNNALQLKEVVHSERFNMSKNVSLDHMFQNNKKLTSIDVSTWDVSKTTRLDWLFANCDNLGNIDMRNWNTSNVINMSGIFMNCFSMTDIDVSSFNTSKVTQMTRMFSGCINVEKLDLSNFSSESLINISAMFSHYNFEEHKPFETSKLKEIIFGEKFTTEKVEQLEDLFSSIPGLTQLDLSKWSSAKFQNAKHFVNGSINLKTIYVNKDFKAPSTMKKNGALFGNSLVGGNGTTHKINSDTEDDNSYFQADTDSQKGLFTLRLNIT